MHRRGKESSDDYIFGYYFGINCVWIEKMKGTIDQVEAFFEGISSAWWRVVIIFMTCWAAHLLGSAAANYVWRNGLGWGGPSIGYRIYLLPADWMLTLLFNTRKAAGIPVVLALVGFGYLMMFTERARLPLILVAGLIQAWWTWYCEVDRFSVGAMFEGDTAEPLPGLLLMLTVTSLAAYLWEIRWRTRNNECDL